MNIRSKSVSVFLTCVLADIWPAAYSANSYEYTAKSADNARRQGVVTANGIRWKCMADLCTTSGPWPTPGVEACKALAQKVGKIVEYGHAKRKLSKRDLTKCNQSITKSPIAPVTPVVTPGLKALASTTTTKKKSSKPLEDPKAAQINKNNPLASSAVIGDQTPQKKSKPVFKSAEKKINARQLQANETAKIKGLQVPAPVKLSNKPSNLSAIKRLDQGSDSKSIRGDIPPPAGAPSPDLAPTLDLAKQQKSVAPLQQPTIARLPKSSEKPILAPAAPKTIRDSTLKRDGVDTTKEKLTVARPSGLDLSQIQPLSQGNNKLRIDTDRTSVRVPSRNQIASPKGLAITESVLVTAKITALRDDVHRDASGQFSTATGLYLCIGDICQGRHRTRFQSSALIAVCRQLAPLAGPIKDMDFVSRNSSRARRLSSAELRQCNSGITRQAAVAQPAPQLDLHADAFPGRPDIVQQLNNTSSLTLATGSVNWRCRKTYNRDPGQRTKTGIGCQTTYRGDADDMTTVCGNIAGRIGVVHHFRWTRPGQGFGIQLTPAQLHACNETGSRYRRLASGAARYQQDQQTIARLQGERLFDQHCAECHSSGSGRGPDLLRYGVRGQCYGYVDPNYHYSKSLKKAGYNPPRWKQGQPALPRNSELRGRKFWDAASLDTMIRAPRSIASRTSMPAVPLGDEARRDVVQYLMSIAPNQLRGYTCGWAEVDTSEETLARGRTIYNQSCASCHNGDTAPNLQYFGVKGKSAGRVDECYAATPALRAADFKWGRYNLHHWILDPTRKVPGTSMPKPSLDYAETQAVTEYLLSLATRTSRDCNMVAIAKQATQAAAPVRERALRAQRQQTEPLSRAAVDAVRKLAPVIQQGTSTSSPPADAQSAQMDRDAMIARGSDLFTRKCSVCHGGTSPGYPKIERCGLDGVRVSEVGGDWTPSQTLKEYGGSWNASRLRDTLKHGSGLIRIGNMAQPALDSEQDRDALVEFLMSLPVVAARDPNGGLCRRPDLLNRN